MSRAILVPPRNQGPHGFSLSVWSVILMEAPPRTSRQRMPNYVNDLDGGMNFVGLNWASGLAMPTWTVCSKTCLSIKRLSGIRRQWCRRHFSLIRLRLRWCAKQSGSLVVLPPGVVWSSTV